MKYMGSKNRIANHIVPMLDAFNDRTAYVEPFVGGANIIDKVRFQVRIGSDKNKYLIALLDHVASGKEMPQTIAEKEYYSVRDNKTKYPDWYVGLVGFCASYGGRFFEGYPRGKNADGTDRDYTNESIRNLLKQKSNIEGVRFECNDFVDLDLKDIPCLIYCDPPYYGSKPYKIDLLGKFDTKLFWDWVMGQGEYNPVIVSEYVAPSNFICIWESEELSSNLKISGTKTSKERLFIDSRWEEEFADRFQKYKSQYKLAI